jgi:uncharacterized protein
VIDLSELKTGIKIKDKIATLAIYVQPNAKRTEFEKIHDDQLKLKVKAPPEEGKANAEIIRYLADFFSLRKNQIVITNGELSKRKRVELNFDKPVTIEILSEYFQSN